jgi:predicted CXXCH cytochrome family protein
LFIVLLCVIFLGSAGWKGMWETGVHTGYQPIQPIKFSHQLHAGVNKIDCQYCHSGAFTSKNASIPSLNVCMNCHNYVTASEKYDGKTSPEIMKIYNALDYNEDTKVYGKIPSRLNGSEFTIYRIWLTLITHSTFQLQGLSVRNVTVQFRLWKKFINILL